MIRPAWILKTLLSHWVRHPMQFATLLIGLASATALWSGVQAINAQARSSYDRAAAAFGGNSTAMLVPTHDSTVPQSLFAGLRRAGWLVSPVIEGRVRIGDRQVRIMGVEPVTLPRGAGPSPGVQDASLEQFLAPGGQTLVAPETAHDLGAGEGARISVATGESLPPFHVATNLIPDLLVMDIGWAQRILHEPDLISRFLVDPIASGDRSTLQQVAGDNLRLVEAGAETDLQSLTASFHLNLTAFGLLSFLVGLFIVYSAIGLAFEQRLPMFRTLRACGVTAKGLVLVLVTELIAIAALAGLAGVACGYLIASALLPDVAASLRGLYGANVPGQLSITATWWLAGLAMSVIGALVAASHGLFKVLRLPLLVSAQPEAWQRAQQSWLIWQVALACIAFALGGLSFEFGTSLVAGFAVLAGLLLGAALLLPAVLSVILRAGESLAQGPVSRWAWADSRQELSGLSLALMALLLALAVNVGVGTMVGSFSDTFQRWINGRLAADIYLEAKDSAQRSEIETWLRSRADVQAVLPNVRAETEIGKQKVELFGIADHAIYREQWPLLETSANVWDRVAKGTAVLVSEQLARRLDLHVGAEISIPYPAGDWNAEVGGIYADYGNPRGQIAVNFDQLVQRFADADRTRLGLLVTKNDVNSLMADIENRFGLSGRNLADQSTVKVESLRIFNRTFTVTAALNAFTLAVAGIALFTSLLTLGQARLAQLAPLWAIGLTRSNLAWLELTKTLALALITSLLALPLGIIVAWCLIAVVNVKAFGWRLPLEVFPDQLVRLLLVSIFAAFLATLIPIIKLIRTPPITLLKIFADER
jgi:putative ABC transport system permease protein